MVAGDRTASGSYRRARARALAGFFAAGAALSVAVVLLPGWEQVHTVGIMLTVVAATGGALLLWTFAHRFRRGWIHLFAAAGTTLIGGCQILAGGGSPTAMYAMLYVWVALHGSLFFPRTVVAGHIVLTTAAHATALVWLGDLDSIGPQLTLTLGTQVAAGWVVGSLAARQRELADTDPLTGLHNRRAGERALEGALVRSRQAPSPTACVALLDLDGFKAFNDRHGHLAGDDVLVEVARRWRGQLGRGDRLARTGGDEFLLVLGGGDLRAAEATVRAITARTPPGVSVSAGLARCRPDDSPATVLARADAALYRAKAGGPVVLADDDRPGAGSPPVTRPRGR